MDFSNFVTEAIKDIYGFEKARAKNMPLPVSEDPTDSFDSSLILKELARHPVNNKSPRVLFSSGDVAWGEGAGMIRCDASPNGSDRINIRRLLEDLEGNPTWITKKIIPLTEIFRKESKDEQDYAFEILSDIEKIDLELVNMPIKDYKNLEKLVFKLAGQVKLHAPDIFIYEGIRRLNPALFVIYMNLRAGGVQARDQKRIDEFTINVNYNSGTGIIRCWGNGVGSNIAQHKWAPQVSNWDESFCPSQPEHEILDSIINALKVY